MSQADRAYLNEQLERFEKHVPRRMASALGWLRKPEAIWFRVPVALLLIAAGFVGFLPILGFWMVPLGLILIALDIPPLRRPFGRFVAWALDKWEARQRRKK